MTSPRDNLAENATRPFGQATRNVNGDCCLDTYSGSLKQKRMKTKRTPFSTAAFALALCLLAPASTTAHPHSFLEAQVSFVFDDQGLAGFRQKWVIDEMTALYVLEDNRENGDGKLDAKEVSSIKEVSMGALRDYGYFTDVRINGEPFRPNIFTDFHAVLDNGKLIYDFFIPCHVKAISTKKEMVLAIYDKSFYTCIVYASKDGTNIDPTKDPRFADSATGADPHDFKRFSEAVDLKATTADIRLEGPVEKFDITSEVRAAPEMAYFEGQIEPEAFVITFKTR